MIERLSPEKIAEICKGRWYRDRLPKNPLKGACIDSRKMADDMLFIALQGMHTDGHNFISTLDAEQGHAALVERPAADANIPQLCVLDSLKGLQALARHNAANTKARKIALTGSVGKTGTKDMIAQMLAYAGLTHATAGNLNNHIGVPLTLLGLPCEADFLVCEMGMNHAGEMAELSEMVVPDIAIITKISASHAGHFKSLSDIAEAKAEIFLHSTAMATAILPRDDEFYGQLAGSARLSGINNLISFGAHKDSTIRMEAVTKSQTGQHIKASLPDKRDRNTRIEIGFDLSMRAAHWAENALCAIATAYALDLDIQKLLPAFSTMTEPAGRGRLHQLMIKDNAYLLIDDSYNASPASMIAALRDLGEMNARLPLAILTDMLELGDHSHSAHLQLAEELIQNGIAKVITAGPLMRQICASLPEQITAVSFDDSDSLIQQLKKDATSLLKPSDVLLVKGSHGSGAYKIAQHLINEFTHHPSAPIKPDGGACHAA